MSKSIGQGEPDKESFRDIIRETFSAHTKSEQYFDHPDAPEKRPGAYDRHNDGEDIKRTFRLEPFSEYLTRAARQEHPVEQHPRALAHFVAHLKDWEKWELSQPDPDFGDLPQDRQKMFDWFLGRDKDDPVEREEARERRTEQLIPGGTGIVLHGKQGSTKTTAMYWLIANIMHVNQNENVIWQSTLDDTEWQVLGPWTTLCLPENVEVRFTANPHHGDYRHLGRFEIAPDDIARQVIRYEDPEDLMQTLADRRPGQMYVVYPDPHFRKCQALTTWSYESMWDVDDSSDATGINHFWFALMEAIVHGSEYNEWTTLVGDEAHKWLQHEASDDEHYWHKKVKDWSTYWGDARKKRLSCILSVHKWSELHHMARGKIRWGATMNNEEFPSAAPVSGKNTWDQSLGDLCIWDDNEWNHVGYPNLKQKFSVPANIDVEYPGFEAVKQAKS